MRAHSAPIETPATVKGENSGRMAKGLLSSTGYVESLTNSGRSVDKSWFFGHCLSVFFRDSTNR